MCLISCLIGYRGHDDCLWSAGMNELKEREHSLTNQLEETRHAYEHEKGIISNHVLSYHIISCHILISHVLQEFIRSPVFVCTQVSYRQWLTSRVVIWREWKWPMKSLLFHSMSSNEQRTNSKPRLQRCLTVFLYVYACMYVCVHACMQTYMSACQPPGCLTSIACVFRFCESISVCIYVQVSINVSSNAQVPNLECRIELFEEKLERYTETRREVWTDL